MGYILYLALLLFVVIGVLIFTVLYYTDNRDRLGDANKELNSIDTELSNISNQFVLNVSKGSIENYSVRNIFGWQESVPDYTNGLIPLWENPTAYTYPVSPGLSMTITSRVSDDGGTVLIKGLDSDGSLKVKELT